MDDDFDASFDHRDGEQDALRSFIDRYKLSPELWNPNNPLYSNRMARNSALDRLIPFLVRMKPWANKRVDVKRKINSIRTNHRRELKKVVASKALGKSVDEVYTPASWVYFALSFLEKVEKPIQIDPIEPAMKEEEIEQEEDSMESQEMNAQPNQTSANFTTSRSSMLTRLSPLQSTQNRKSRMQSVIMHRVQSELLQKTCKLMEITLNRERNIPIIAKVWGEKLLILDPKQRIFAEKAINDILFEASLGTLHRNSVKINVEHDPLK